MALTHALADATYRHSGGDTITGVPIGTASADRVVCCILTAPGVPTTATIGGIAAVLTSLTNNAWAVSAAVPTGTTADFVLNGAGDWQTCGVWTVTGGAAVAPSANGCDVSGAGLASVAVTAGGCVLGTLLDGGSGTTEPNWASVLSNEALTFAVSSGTIAVRCGGANFATGQTVAPTVTGCIFPAPFLVAFQAITAPTGDLAATEAADTAAITGSVPVAFQYLGVGTVVETLVVGHTLSLTGIAARQPGDLLVACIGLRSTSTTSVSLPSGWTLVNEQKTNNTLTTTSAVASGVMAYHVRGASDPALTFTHPAGISVARGTIVAYRPLKPVALDVSSAATTAINTTSVSVAGLTTTTPTELLVEMAVGGQEATWTNFDAVTDPTTTSGTGSAQTADPIAGAWQERSDTNTTSGADMSLAVADAVRATAGATGNFTATASLGASHVIIVGAFKYVASGALATTEALDVAAIAGDVTATSISGTLVATEAADVALINGGVVVSGTIAATEAVDVANFILSPVIPTSPIFVPGHALLTNMLACYLPGVQAGVPVSGTGPTLANGAGGAGTVVSTVEGPALRSNSLGAAKGLIATAPSAFKAWTNFTIFWRGVIIGAGDAFCPLLGVSSTDADVAPYFMINVATTASGYTQLQAYYGDSSTSEVTPFSNVTGQYGSIIDVAATVTVGGNVTFYVNGVSIGTNTMSVISTSNATAKIAVNQGIDATSRSPNASCNMACFWDRTLSGADILGLHNDPYAFLQSGVSGTLAATEAGDTAAITGQLGVIGTLAATETSDTAAINVAATHTATLAATEAADVASINATVRHTAVLAATETADTALLNGVAYWLVTLGVTEVADTAAINAVVRWLATLAATETADTALINVVSQHTATLAATEAVDVALIDGMVRNLGTLASTEAPDVAIIGGGIYGTGTLAAVEASDVASISGSLAGAGVAGSLIAVEAPDTALINGSVTGVVGALAATEAADTAAVNASVAWTGVLAASETPDTAAFNATVRWNAVLAAIETPDTAAINVTVAAMGRPVKVWNGSAWVTKTTKVWSGSAWITRPVKVWNGGAWV